MKCISCMGEGIKVDAKTMVNSTCPMCGGIGEMFLCPKCGELMENDHNSSQCHNCEVLYPHSYLREL